eukprot:TRINITY_DN35948_c0_g1_i7.p1 TRINITY_DN35948_c0_g1~~TRINITY_DN35948_c0_g1_i7.p1  ORF type:complete len:287 (+),score=58.76 TRINITY_DN35948_c0_g1_i7:411-1271(+)
MIWMTQMDEKGVSGIRNWKFSDQGANVSSVLKPISNAGVSGGAIFDGSSGVSEYQSTFLKMNAFSDRNSMTSEAAELTNWVNQKNYLSETKASPNQMEAIETDLADIHMVLGASVDATQNGEFKAKPAELKKQQPSAKKSNRQFASKVLRPKQSKKNSSPLTNRRGSSVASVKLEKKNANAVVNGTTLDMSRVPPPICSCTGVPHRCYRWGAGGWQSSCCTLSISEYPLPMSPSRPTARMAGRKMSSGAYSKLLERLATEGYSLSNPVDLKDHWARHGTNKYATIK